MELNYFRLRGAASDNDLVSIKRPVSHFSSARFQFPCDSLRVRNLSLTVEVYSLFLYKQRGYFSSRQSSFNTFKLFTTLLSLTTRNILLEDETETENRITHKKRFVQFKRFLRRKI